MQINKRNPKDSNVYRYNDDGNAYDPEWGRTTDNVVFLYKHAIPSGLGMQINKRNPKDSNVYRYNDDDNAYDPEWGRTTDNVVFLYKHLITLAL